MPYDTGPPGSSQLGASSAPRWPSSPLVTHPAFTADNIGSSPQPHRKQGGKENAAPSDRGRARNVSPTKALLAKAIGAARAASPERRAKKEAATRGREDRDSGKQQPISDADIAAQFANLLTELQVAPEQRRKLLAMDTGVKAAMLKGSSTLNLSSFGLESPRKARTPLPAVADEQSFATPLSGAPTGLWRQGSAEDVFADAEVGPSSPRKGRSRANSLVGGSGSRETALASLASDSAISLATLLKTTCTAKLDVARMKRLRAVISSESPSWIDEFADEGGIRALLGRLKELLDKEWREEQHDDMLLHEILRALIALTNTDRGKIDLATAQPSPFVDLATLLFSEKKPGDLTTRKYLVDLLTLVMDMPVASILSDDAVQKSRQLSTCWAYASSCRLAPGLLLLLCLLHNPRSPEKEAVLDFITASHSPRPFKTYVVELGGVCRDYFWVFCHAKNRYWDLGQVDVQAVEGPKVPGGMTGGVEFEAMAYLTSNLRLVNKIGMALLAGAQSRQAALEFHQLLFASGMERVLATLRRASQTYYAPLHLELSRYMDLASRSGFTLPANIAVWRLGNQSLPSVTGGAGQATRSTTESRAMPSSPVKSDEQAKRAPSPSRAEAPARSRPTSAYEAMRQAQREQEAARERTSPSAAPISHAPAAPSSQAPVPAHREAPASMLPSPSLSFPSEPDLSFHFSLGTFSTAERDQLIPNDAQQRSSADAWTPQPPQQQPERPKSRELPLLAASTGPSPRLGPTSVPSSPFVHPSLGVPSLPAPTPSSPLMPAWRHADLGVRRTGASNNGGSAQGSIVGTAIKAWESRGRSENGGGGGVSPNFGPTRRL